MDDSKATEKKSKTNEGSIRNAKKRKKKKKGAQNIDTAHADDSFVPAEQQPQVHVGTDFENVDGSEAATCSEKTEERNFKPADEERKLKKQEKTAGCKDLGNSQSDKLNIEDNSGDDRPKVSSSLLEQPEEKPSPNSSRKKKKKKKAKEKKGFLLSRVLEEPQDDLTSKFTKKKDEEENEKDIREDAKESPSKEEAADEESEEEKGFTEDKEEGKKNDIEMFTRETSLLSNTEKERNNFFQIVTLVYGVGLQALRKVFMDVHPTWSNKPADAKSLVKGVMKLKGHEATSFNDGNINKWDVSLLTTVLLYSKKCKTEISKRLGFEDAIRSIKDHKNRLISHVDSERMPDAEFHSYWPIISDNIVTIGGKLEDIEGIMEGDVLETGKFYRGLFLEEIHTRDALHSKVSNIDKKLDLLIAEKSLHSASEPDSPTFKDLSGPKWDEWMRFCDKVGNFDYHQNNYILITDAMSRENMLHFSPLRSVPWKIVLDFDPCSEEKGMYHDFISKEGNTSLINMVTPDEIRRQHTTNLARHLDTHKTQWVFVNGREKDSVGGPQTLQDWKNSSVKQITRFFSCCSDADKLDRHKPIICLVLPCREETVPFLTVTLDRLKESFDDFTFNFVGIKQTRCYDLETDISFTDLSPDLLGLGLASFFQAPSAKEYRLPTSQAKLPVKLTQNQYLFLQEYLEVLYDGCEDLPDFKEEPDGEELLKKVINEHRDSFMSGNWISFISLFDNHDARREIGNEVKIHIQRLLDQGPTHSTIVEICHSPGTGGSTIARRVLWDLHKSFPCAIANMEGLKGDFDEDLVWINALADRISDLQDLCRTTPLVLLDGKHAIMEAISNKLVRVLNNRGLRVVLLRCLHRSRGSAIESNCEASYVHERFSVNVKLEESRADLNEFEAKYKDFIEDFTKNKTKSSLCRVFHFPLIAMLEGLEGFGRKLESIVYDTFDEMTSFEKEVAVLVAFIQKYAAQATPASLLYEAFKPHFGHKSSDTDKGITYEDINQPITEQLLNLMVPTKPAAIRRGGRRPKVNSFPESYTLQHPLVADLVLKKVYMDQKRDTLALTREFLEFPIFQDERFFSLINDMFIRNRSSTAKARFSILFEELKLVSSSIAAQIFRDVADKAEDATLYGHAARFHTKKNPPSFSTARELIAKAFQCKNVKTKARSIFDMKGGILQNELKCLANTHKIDSLSSLQGLADEALQSYKKARNFPPTFPNPLLGEVKVWIACIEWITKYQCNGDSDETIKFLNSAAAPAFFRTCVGDSFYLLDLVDGIAQSSVTLPDPEETQRQANTLRVSLMRTFNKGRRTPVIRKDKDDVIQACIALCSTENFPKSSHTELKRLQAHYIISCVDGQIENIKKEHLEFLAKLLESLVLVENQGYSMAYHLMKVCLLITEPKHYSLEKGLQVAEKWIHESSYNPLPYFYQMMIYFLKIMDGNHLLYRDSYHKAIKMCQENSQHNCRGAMSTHFLKRSGEGMNRLMTKSALLSGEAEYPRNVKDFWTIHSRKKLLECRGRIRVRPQKSGRRKQLYIELAQGNVELYVGKNADIGQVERDFPQGSNVYFVVSFNLQGPVANGITFAATSTEGE